MNGKFAGIAHHDATAATERASGRISIHTHQVRAALADVATGGEHLRAVKPGANGISARASRAEGLRCKTATANGNQPTGPELPDQLVVAESQVAEMHDGRGQRLITKIQAAQDRPMLERTIYLHIHQGQTGSF